MDARTAQRKEQELQRKLDQTRKLFKENPERARVEAKKLAREYRDFENELSAILDPLNRIRMNIHGTASSLERT